MADLLLGLGAAVVKAACKVWLKDRTFAADASAGVVDAIRMKVAGELDQRQARRLFEDLEVPVAAKVGVLRQHEFAGMADNEWAAAVLAVGDTLRGARFTDADIFAGDLDPLYLRRHIRAGGAGMTRDLSQAGAALYDRLLTECCAYIVELTSTLPHFSAGAFAEILRRQSVILQKATEVLDRMPSPDEIRAGQTRAETDFAAAYRRQVATRLDRLELFGVTVSESIRGYPLSTAYISLAVASGSLAARGLEDRLRPANVTPGSQPALDTLRIDDALVLTSRLFLRGEAGSGKTTLLQRLAVQAARRDFPSRLSAWNDSMPFLIRLRHYAGKDLPGPEGFLGQVGHHIADTMPTGWVHRLLEEGQALVLVDGVDELPPGQRHAAREWLAALVNTFPKAKFVVTSRPGAVSSQWLDRERFDAAEVQPMTGPDVREFVRHWHAAFRDESAEEEQRAHLSACEQELLEALYARRHLRLLATNPLLCALICALHLDRRMQLPRDRMELYAVALDMLLERRDLERQVPEGRPPLSKTDKALLLEDLAYWLIRNGWSDAQKDRVVLRINQRLATMPKVAADGSKVLDGLLERSGLIREPVADRIDFVHRTFQEYLAAHAAVSDDQIGELVRNADDDQWREVVVLAAGHAQPRQRGELLNGLLARAHAESSKQQALQTLAVACLETSPELDPGLYAAIQEAAAALLPPNSIRRAEVLATIGEPLLDLLADRPVRSARQAAATIRAASLIGGDAALRLIASLAALPGSAVREAVIRAWPMFGAEEYATVVLSGSPHGTSIRIEDPALLPALRHLQGLDWLNINFATGHGDLAIVRDLPQLTGLYIMKDPKLGDLGPLSRHPKLECLVIRCDGPVDLSPLATLAQLRRLTFWPGKAANIKALRECPRLEHIDLMDPPADTSLTALLPERRLESLDLVGHHLEDLSQLFDIFQLASLRKLILSSCKHLRSINGVERWSGTLRSFGLWNSGAVTDLTPLTGLPELEELHLTYGAAQNLSIALDLPTLRRLHLYSEEPTDLTPLRGVTELTVHVTRRQVVHGGELLGEGSKIVRN